MRLQTMTSSPLLVALCALLLSGCGVSTAEERALSGAGQAGALEDAPASPQEDDGKVTLCHIPPGNPANAHTLRVGAPAVDAHLRHGDFLGACEGTGEPDAGSPEPDAGTPPVEPDAGTPEPDAGTPPGECAVLSEACGAKACCTGLTCQAGFCSPVLD